MALVVGTNTSALYSQNAMKTNARSTATAMERLSTGVRVNSAKDDAAGLAIGQNMTSYIRGLNQAVRNINDGINLVQTADGGLSSITDMLQRMRELAVQSANGTNSDVQRAYLQKESTALKAQIGKVVDTTMWNDQNLLDGTFAKPIQIGSDVGTKMDIVIPAMGTVNLLPPTSGTTESASIQFPGMTLGQSITVDGLTFTAKQTITGSQVATAFASLAPGAATGAGTGYGHYHGALAGFTSAAAVGNQLQMTSAEALQDVPDISVSTNGVGQTASPVINTVQGHPFINARSETASINFKALAPGQAVTVGGLKFTATKALTATDVAGAFANIQTGAITGPGTNNGSYSGSLTGYSSGPANADTVVMTSNIANTNVTNLSATVSASLTTIPVVSITQGVDGQGPIPEKIGLVFLGLSAGQSVSAGGLTFTANRTTTDQEVAAAFTNLATNATTGPGSGYGTYSGTLVGFSSSASSVAVTEPTQEWIKPIGGNIRSITTAPDGFIYAAGAAAGAGSNDIYLTKLNPDGTQVWSQLLGDSGNQFATSVKVGPDGGIYVTGQTSVGLTGATLDFQNIHNTNTSYPEPAATADSFIAKYNPDGTKVWAKDLHTYQNQYATASTITYDGSIYIVGTVRNISGWDGGRVPAKPYYDNNLMVTKYDSQGVFAWQAQLGVNNNKQDFALDADGFEVVGYSYDSMGEYWGTNQNTLTVFNVPNAGGPVGDYPFPFYAANSATILASEGKATAIKYVPGGYYITGTTYGGGGVNGGFLAKYTPGNGVVWTHNAPNDPPEAITVGIDGSVYVSGSQPQGSLTKFTADGTKIWTKPITGIGAANFSGLPTDTNLTAGLDGSIYVSGYFHSNPDEDYISGSLTKFSTFTNSVTFTANGYATESATDDISASSNVVQPIGLHIEARVATGSTETATIAFPVMKAGQFITVSGLTFTANKDLTGDQVAAAFAGMANGNIAGQATVSDGSYSGTFTSSFVTSSSSGNTITATNTVLYADVPDIQVSGSLGGAPTAPTVTVTDGNADTLAQTETSSVQFSAMQIGQSLTIAGLRFTATSQLNGDQVAAAFANLVDGSTTGPQQALGIYSGTLIGFHSGASSTSQLLFVSSQTGSNVTDIGVSTGGAIAAPDLPAVQIMQGSSNPDSIAEIDLAIDRVLSARATMGSYLNTLAYAADNVTNVSSNSTQSRSTILDADYAIETTNLAKNQIIQQAATAMLAQANTQPQAVMALLKNM